MKSAITQLAYKEWRENGTGMALGCFILGGFTAVALQSRLVPDLAVLIISMMMGLVLAGFIAMSTVAPDREQGTIGLLLSLPIPSWKILMVKTAIGILLLVGPIALTWLLFWLMAGGREVGLYQIHRAYMAGMAASVSMYLWIMSIGIRQPTEARVGLGGVVFVVTIFLTILFLDEMLRVLDITIQHMLVFTPLGAFTVITPIGVDPQFWPSMLWYHAIIGIVVWLWAAWRFGKLNKTRG